MTVRQFFAVCLIAASASVGADTADAQVVSSSFSTGGTAISSASGRGNVHLRSHAAASGGGRAVAHMTGSGRNGGRATGAAIAASHGGYARANGNSHAGGWNSRSDSTAMAASIYGTAIANDRADRPRQRTGVESERGGHHRRLRPCRWFCRRPRLLRRGGRRRQHVDRGGQLRLRLRRRLGRRDRLVRWPGHQSKRCLQRRKRRRHHLRCTVQCRSDLRGRRPGPGVPLGQLKLVPESPFATAGPPAVFSCADGCRTVPVSRTGERVATPRVRPLDRTAIDGRSSAVAEPEASLKAPPSAHRREPSHA